MLGRNIGLVAALAMTSIAAASAVAIREEDFGPDLSRTPKSKRARGPVKQIDVGSRGSNFPGATDSQATARRLRQKARQVEKQRLRDERSGIGG